LPKDHAHYEGLYVHGDKVILSYTVGGAEVLEMPQLERGVITRTIQGSFPTPAVLSLAKEGTNVTSSEGTPTVIDGRIVLQLPAGNHHFKISYGAAADVPVADPLADLRTLLHGGAARFPESVITKGEIAKDDGKAAYLLDRLTVPYQNPYGVPMRIGGLDFFTSDPSKAAVSTWDGDVWVISGIDDSLDHLVWKRFAAGGHETLGLTIVDDVIYTVADDQITRYHDLNGDGEADYYENFNNDWELTSGFHAFCFDLESGPAGDFYFAFGSPVRGGGRSFERMGRHHGSIIKVSKDGSKLERYATGLRAPNGIGVSPTGQVTSGDNEGTFVPRVPIHWIEEGEFLGVVDSSANYATMNTTPTVEQRSAGRAQSLDSSEAPMPLAWLPKNVDNSNGGQVWVTSDKWGPFKGEMLHMSYGQSALYVVLKEKKGDLMQGGVVKIPVRPTSSAMRGKFNAKDGQLYIAGLKGWQTNAGAEGGLDRVRYTGRPVAMPHLLKVHDGGIEIGFTQKIDRELAEDPDSYSLSGSDIRWTHNYGTDEYEVGQRDSANQKKGRTKFTVKSAKLLQDGQSVFVEVENLQPVHLMQIDLDLETEDGKEIRSTIWNTIHVAE
jgi:glucose/arabinose dehydrogenase